MKKTFSTLTGLLIAAVISTMPAMADNAVTTSQENTIVGTTEDTTSPMVPLTYRNITFEAPASYTAEGTIPYLVKAPDGSFGLSLEVGDANGCNLKRCKAFCTDMAKTLNISNTNFKELRVNGFKGAALTGTMGELQVKLAVLYKGNKEIRSVMMYYPKNEQTAQKILYSFK